MIEQLGETEVQCGCPLQDPPAVSSFVFMISGLTGGEGGTIYRRGRDSKKHTLENFHLERASLPKVLSLHESLPPKLPGVL